MLKISDIKMVAGTQAREEVNAEKVTEYCEAIKCGVTFPPVDIFFDGDNFFVADGWHRILAHIQAGKEAVNETIHAGSARQAKLFSLSANATHGLTRTSADKRKAVMTMLNDAEWKTWSAVSIAKACAVSDRFVGKVKDELGIDKSIVTYADKNGVQQTMNTAIYQEKKHEMIDRQKMIDAAKATDEKQREEAKLKAEQVKAEYIAKFEAEVEKNAKEHIGDYKEADTDELAEAYDTIEQLNNEVNQLRNSVICQDVESLGLSDNLIDGYKKKIVALTAELDAAKTMRDSYMRELNELKSMYACQSGILKKLQNRM